MSRSFERDVNKKIQKEKKNLILLTRIVKINSEFIILISLIFSKTLINFVHF